MHFSAGEPAEKGLVQLSGLLWQPLDDSFPQRDMGSSYKSWLFSKVPPNPSLWESQTFKAKEFSGSILTTSKRVKEGEWNTFKVQQELFLLDYTKITFPDVTFLGAIFGLFFGRVAASVLSPDNPFNFSSQIISLFRKWNNFERLPDVIPDYYEISNLAISIVDENPIQTSHNSISNVGELPLRKHLIDLLVKHPEINQFIQYSGVTQLDAPIFRLGLIFSLLFENAISNFSDRVQTEGVVISSSDEVWLFDTVRPRPSTTKIVVTLYHSTFSKIFNPTTTADLIPIINTGCRGNPSALHRIFSKSKNMRATLLFSPVGVSNGQGRNCILECIEHFLSENSSMDTPSVEEFQNEPQIKALESDVINLQDVSVLKLINKFSKLKITCYYEKVEDNGDKLIVDLGWPSNPDGVNAEPLRLLAHCQGQDEFGFPIWHACIVSGYGRFKDKTLCKNCGEWFASTSPHFSNCTVCTKCFKAYNKNGNHYISCKGKQIIAEKSKSEGKIAPSAVNHAEWQLWRNVWFADFECFQNSVGIHIPYLVVLQGISTDKPTIFWGKSCLKEFIEYITDPSNKISGYLYCHNGSGYDFNLILVGLLQYCEKFSKKPINVLMRGSKILTCQISSKPPLTLRDTYLLMPASLSKLCKDLKIKQEFAKTAFEHSKIFSFESATSHRAEVTKYCIQDVLALKQIFKLFSRAMWDIAPVLLQSSMSLASHALELWKILEAGPVLNSLSLPSLDVYKLLRNMYHGGRVLATLPKYDSKYYDIITDEDEDGNFTFFDDDGVTLKTFAEIKASWKQLPGKEEIKQLDVVSLYPHVMHDQEFPVGSFIPISVWESDENAIAEAQSMSQIILTGKWVEIEHDGETIRAEQPAYQFLKKEMFRHCYQVDIDCPSDAIVAFLMRKVNDVPVQNLEPLESHWLTGVELFEAIKVGYTLKRIKAKFGWDSLGSVFRKYIGILFKIKEDNKKDKSSVMYLVAKLLMNALSGKFGQKIVSKVTKLLSELPEDPDKVFKDLIRVHNQIIERVDEKQNTSPVGYLFTAEKSEESLETSLPTHLSVFILAHSRRKMSKMLRYAGGYYDPKRTIMYTDTDSMVVNKTTYEKLKIGKFIGGKLGQLEDEFPNEIIIAGRFLAPKVYVLMMLKQLPDSDKAAIAYKVRCKGIPHRGDVFFGNSYSLDEREFKVKLDEISDSISGPVADLAKRFYVVKSKQGDAPVLIHPFINISICDLILSEKFYLQIHFGSILKSSKIKFALQSKWVTRSLGFNSWWNNPLCPRILKDQAGYEITGCKSTSQ